MRRLFITVIVLFTTLVTSTALAEPQKAWPGAHEPAFSLALLDGFRAGPLTVQSIAVGQRGATKNNTRAEPGEAVTAYVAEVWSQVRAYRRTGGAELIVRGRF